MKFLIIFTSIFFIAESNAFYDNALGLKIGGDSGVNYRADVKDTNFIDLTIGNELNITYNFYLDNIKVIQPYLGIGGGIDINENPDVNLRIPFGGIYRIPNQKISVFLELTAEFEDKNFKTPLSLGLNYNF